MADECSKEIIAEALKDPAKTLALASDLRSEANRLEAKAKGLEVPKDGCVLCQCIARPL